MFKHLSRTDGIGNRLRLVGFSCLFMTLLSAFSANTELPIITQISFDEDIQLQEGTDTANPNQTKLAFFTLRRSAKNLEAEFLEYEIDQLYSTAKWNEDFRTPLIKGTLAFEPGQDVIQIPVEIIQDSIKEPIEFLQIHLLNPDSRVHREWQRIYIQDDDITVGFEQSRDYVPEIDTPSCGKWVRLSAAVDYDVEVLVKLAEYGDAKQGVDFEFSEQLLHFAAGETRAFVPYRILEDEEIETKELFSLQLAAPQNMSLEDGNSQSDVVILENDQNDFSQFLFDSRIVTSDTTTGDSYAFSISGSTNIETLKSKDFDYGPFDLPLQMQTEDYDVESITAQVVHLKISQHPETRQVEVNLTLELTFPEWAFGIHPNFQLIRAHHPNANFRRKSSRSILWQLDTIGWEVMPFGDGIRRTYHGRIKAPHGESRETTTIEIKFNSI